MLSQRLIPATLLAAVITPSASALDHVTLRRDDSQIKIQGRHVLTAADGGILLMATDGILWAIQPEELVQCHRDDTPFEPLSAKMLGEDVLEELPEGFAVYHTVHYVILHDTSREYAQWCGALFERLHRAFTNFWRRRGFALSEPEFPLVAILFNSKASYTKFSRAEVGDAVESMIGYYSLHTNRMVFYDLTGQAGRSSGSSTLGASMAIRRFLANPASSRAVATFVHEATHQIAFNCGLHTRLSDCPRWFSEGIAVYFETPDAADQSGWRSIGTVNQVRLLQFRASLARRPSDSLENLLADDTRFLDTATAADAYAETWALTYYLLKRHPKQYIAYLRMLSKKQPMVWDDPAERLRAFREAFGEDLESFDQQFVIQMGGG